MTGRQWTTTSPSRVSSRRSTPCVDGCCGPMLTVSSSRLSGSVSAIRLPRHGEVDGLTAKWLGAPERVALPFVRQHDPLEIWMSLELNPEQVKELALVPIRARNCWRETGCLSIRRRLDAQPLMALQRVEEVRELESSFSAEPVDGREVHETGVAQLRADVLERGCEVSQVNADRGDPVGCDGSGVGPKYFSECGGH